MNNISLIGNLGARPEVAKTKSDISVVSFDIAVKRRYKNSEGEYPTDWIRVVAWRGLADLVGQHLDKGSRIGVIGSLETDFYEKDGVTIKTHQVVANEITFLSKKSEDNQTDPFASDEKVVDLDGEELPFGEEEKNKGKKKKSK